MFLFVGDSHSRQFQTNTPGTWGFVSFSGVTIKGLASPESEHGRVIRHLADAPIPKTLFLMLGAVDLDVTFYRNLALGREEPIEAFLAERVGIYRRFVDDLPGELLEGVCVLAPQLTPLGDETFVPATAAMADLDEAAFAVVLDRVDCSHAARCARQVLFNDLLEDGFAGSARASLHRIDRAMMGEEGLIRPAFRPAKPREHHADPAATLPLWQEALQEIVVPHYRSAVRQRLRAAKAAARAEALARAAA